MSAMIFTKKDVLQLQVGQKDIYLRQDTVGYIETNDCMIETLKLTILARRFVLPDLYETLHI